MRFLTGTARDIVYAMTRVLIVDDHAVVRNGLRHLFSLASDISVIGEADDGAGALGFLAKHADECDTVVLDISLPGRNGLDVLKQIKISHPRLPVLILSMHSEEDYALRCFKSGAAGYVRKDSSGEAIIEAVRKVARGGRYVDHRFIDTLHFSWGRETPAPHTAHHRLTDREFQVMCMLACGKSTSQIADELCLSLQTISTYKARILLKMQMPSIAHVIRYAYENGLVA